MTSGSTQPGADADPVVGLPTWQANGSGTLKEAVTTQRPEVELAVAFSAGLILARLLARWARGR